MDGGYAERNYLSVKRTKYTGMMNGYERKKHNSKEVSEKKNIEDLTTRTAPVRIGVQDKYRVSQRTSTAATKKSRDVSAEKGKHSGFVYVEHSGFTGTFRDAFCTKRVKSAEKSCFDKIVLVLLFAVLMFFVAGSYCEYYESFKEAKEIKSQIAECREEQSKLLVAIEERNNRMNLEEYAVNNLGMVKSDKLTKHYVNISEKDVVSITVTEEDTTAGTGVLLSGFKSVISNFLGEN